MLAMRVVSPVSAALGLGVAMLACSGLLLLASGSRAVSAASTARPGPVLTFYFGLKRPEAKAVAAFWAVQQPGSPTYRRFLTPAEIAWRYGASPATRSTFVAAIRRLGLRASIDPSGVFARVLGTTAQLERAFKVKITSLPDETATLYQANRPLRLPGTVRPLVREIVAAFERTAQPVKGATKRLTGPIPPPLRATTPGPKNEGRWTGGCAAARRLGGYSYGQIRHAYGLDRVGAGAGGSVAILNDEESIVPSDGVTTQRCFGYPAGRVRMLRADGQTRRFNPDTPEPIEDLSLVRGTAPRLRAVLQTGVWGNPNLWFLGPARLMRSPQLPDALSISYGYCERAADKTASAGVRLLDAMFVRLGLGGVGVFGSAGDSGSTCDGSPFPGTAWPADSPYVTSVGGTRLVVNRRNQRINEVAWNDLHWITSANGGGAGGGGVAFGYARPPYQRHIHVPGDRRATPDIAVHASMLPGYPIIANGQWIVDGGTSAAAPLAAAAFSTISARLQATGEPPLGPVNGLVYWLERHHPSALYDVISGNNRYDRHAPGHRAHRGYDLATGVGVPRFDRIASLVPRPGH
jgi:Pro-kumamolisin, activation domain